MELQRTDLSSPGIRRRRAGRGFRYFGPGGEPLRDPAAVRRVKALVIPPAWTDVWICPSESGHIQAVGIDAAGRKQYRYHDEWRRQRDREKHDRMLEFADALGRVRKVAAEHLGERGFTRNRVLAATVRLIDLGFFRPGGEEYAEENGAYGLATVLRDHVRCSHGTVTFEYPAKSGKVFEQAVAEPAVVSVVRGLNRRTSREQQLFGYWHGRAWRQVRAEDINEYLREISGGNFTAKDFRTWHATVLAAVGLAVASPAGSGAARVRAVRYVVAEVASYLGNTPAVARASYIDPRVVEPYGQGVTIAAALPDLAAAARTANSPPRDLSSMRCGNCSRTRRRDHGQRRGRPAPSRSRPPCVTEPCGRMQPIRVRPVRMTVMHRCFPIIPPPRS